MKFYAAIMGMSKDNKVGSKNDFYQVMFNLDKKECEKAVKGGWCMTYTKQCEVEADTISHLITAIVASNPVNREHWKISWMKTPHGHDAYVLLSNTNEIVK